MQGPFSSELLFLFSATLHHACDTISKVSLVVIDARSCLVRALGQPSAAVAASTVSDASSVDMSVTLDNARDSQLVLDRRLT